MERSYKDKIKVHKPVLVKEVLEGFGISTIAPLKSQRVVYKKKIIDATVGAGGHAVEIIKRGGFVLGIDADSEMIKIAGKNLKLACPTGNFDDHFILVNGNFRDLDKITQDSKIGNVDGILFDLGISSLHLDSDTRGFSFNNPENPLDMRLSPQTQAVTGSMLLNSLPKNALIDLFCQVLTRNLAENLSINVIRKRAVRPIEKVGDFLEIIEESKIRKKQSKYIGSVKESTLPFLAIRIIVNSEFESLTEALNKSVNLLEKGGRLEVISFHSGEDRIVKNLFKKFEGDKQGSIITKKPITPTLDEIGINPRSRSSKLRIFEKI
jgi:16S rRNA (cytosine1402-N4)-methyltransferase